MAHPPNSILLIPQMAYLLEREHSQTSAISLSWAPLFTELPLSDPWPFFLQGHPESMKIGVGRCHLHVGFPLVPRKKSPTLSVTQEEPCERAPQTVALEHEY